MTGRKKWLLRGAVAVISLLVILTVAVVVVLPSKWFADFVRTKIIAAVEDSTGGRVELQAFEFDWTHLAVRIRNFVLHGTEPADQAPLARVELLEIRLKLLSGLKKAVDIRYLGIAKPRVNLIVFPDGRTNVPEPKVKKQSPSSGSGLDTVVNLAVGEFRIDDGAVYFAQRKTDFAAQGENLRLLLNYRPLQPGYTGQLSVDPLLVRSRANPPLRARVTVPINIERDAIRVANASIVTSQSRVGLNASVSNLKNPTTVASLNANINLEEMARSFSLSLDTGARISPKFLTAQASVESRPDDTVVVNSARLALGSTTFDASGTLDPSRPSTVDFRSTFALPELASLLKLSDVRLTGALTANGAARFDRQKNYSVDGNLATNGLSVRNGSMYLQNVSLHSPFHADPFLISLNGLRLNAVDGELVAKLFIQQMKQMSLEANLRGFSIQNITAALAGKPIGYSSTLAGAVRATGDLEAKGTAGLNAQANLKLVGGSRGVPLDGVISASFQGARNSVDLGKSYLSLPHSRLDLSGVINKNLDVKLLSRNLNDFLPAANFGAKQPQASLPVTFNGGAASLVAQVKGNLSAPQIQSHLAVDRFSVEGRPFDLFALDLAASPSSASVQNGTLLRHGLKTAFDASIGLRKWSPQSQSPLKADVTIRDGELADLLALAGRSSIPASGDLTADIHVNGTYGNPLGSAQVQVVNASAYDQPIDHLFLNVDLADQLIRLTRLELAAAKARLNAEGSFRHPKESFSTGHADFRVNSTDLQLADIRPLVAKSPGVAGVIRLAAALTGDLREMNGKSDFVIADVNADLNATGLRVQNQDAGDLRATANTQSGTVAYQVRSNFAGSAIRVDGKSALAAPYQTSAGANIDNLSVEKVLLLAGKGDVPARGTFDAALQFNGTVDRPEASLRFGLVKALVYQEPINRLAGQVRYTSTSVDVPSISLETPAGSVDLRASFAHPANNFNTGDLNLTLNSSDIEVAKIEHAAAAKEGIGGVLKLAADVAAHLDGAKGPDSLHFSRLDSQISATGLRLAEAPLGYAEFQTRTNGQAVQFRLDSELAKAQLHANGATQLRNDYPTKGSLSFTNIRYENLIPFLSSEPTQAPGIGALVEGGLTVDGPVLKTDNLSARLNLDRLEVRTVPRASPTGAPPNRTVAFRNEGPITIALDKSVVKIEHFDIEGPKTSLKASGGVNLRNTRSPIALSINGNADLSVLQETNKNFYSSGAVSLDAFVRGSLTQPFLNGQIALKNANINYAESPNGLSNANGIILLNGTSATIQSLTGESGGGRVALAGFVGYNSNAVNFNLKANATRVRVRSAGVAVTSDADVSLIGNSRRSLASGLITIRKISYGSSSDAGSFLSAASTPPSTPSSPSPLLAGMRLDVHVVTAPDLRVVTTYADRLGIEANLSVRGTAATPGVIGSVYVTDGQLVFFGNKYTVNTGTVNFYNPTAIQPVVNFSLETIAQNVNVVLGVSGPIDNLALSYRSDPPLTFQQIVQLLATNTTPADPTIAARQPAPAQQSLAQMGSSAILGQAVANPLASRVQRVFGLSALKIDPSIAGANGQPTAKVTLQQKIASNITFTYITDVTQTNSQIIRVEWALTPKLSAVGLRDFNGNVSLQFFYKFKVQ